MYISVIVSIMSSLTHLNGLQLLVLLPKFIEIAFFCLYQQKKSFEFNGKFRQASNYFSRILEAAKIAYASKTKESITFQKLGSWDLANC